MALFGYLIRIVCDLEHFPFETIVLLELESNLASVKLQPPASPKSQSVQSKGQAINTYACHRPETLRWIRLLRGNNLMRSMAVRIENMRGGPIDDAMHRNQCNLPFEHDHV
jgi:hypothetical protein